MPSPNQDLEEYQFVWILDAGLIGVSSLGAVAAAAQVQIEEFVATALSVSQAPALEAESVQ